MTSPSNSSFRSRYLMTPRSPASRPIPSPTSSTSRSRLSPTTSYRPLASPTSSYRPLVSPTSSHRPLTSPTSSSRSRRYSRSDAEEEDEYAYQQMEDIGHMVDNIQATAEMSAMLSRMMDSQ